MQSIFSDKYLWVKYNPLQSLIMHIDWFLFGSPIRELCSHVPLYKGEVFEKPREYQPAIPSSRMS